MSRYPVMPIISKFAALFIAVLSITLCLTPAAKADEKKLRFICVTSLQEEQKVVFASRDAEGKWQEHANLELRNSFISEWFPARTGELHLAEPKNGTLESICQFSYPEDSTRGLVFLIANPEKKIFDAHFVDPIKAKLEKGSLIIFNFSPQAGKVTIGTTEHQVEAGQQTVVKPTPDENGMLQLQVSYKNENGDNQVCYDRSVSSDLNSYGMLFLLPDPTTGLRAIRLSMFGEIK